MKDMVTITREEYEALLADRESLQDIEAYDRAKAEGGESIPADIVNRILDGESPVSAFRHWRGMTQVELASASGIGRVPVAEIETGRKAGSIQTLKALATALGVAVDDLI